MSSLFFRDDLRLQEVTIYTNRGISHVSDYKTQPKKNQELNQLDPADLSVNIGKYRWYIGCQTDISARLVNAGVIHLSYWSDPDNR